MIYFIYEKCSARHRGHAGILSEEFHIHISERIGGKSGKDNRLLRQEKVPAFVIEYKAGGVHRGKTIGKLGAKIKNILRGTIIKDSNSAFTKTDLDKMLKNLNVRKIILVGINANGCVQDTAIGALHRGYSVITSEGVIASASRGDLSLSKKNKEWFMKNTKLFKDVTQSLDYLAN